MGPCELNDRKRKQSSSRLVRMAAVGRSCPQERETAEDHLSTREIGSRRTIEFDPKSGFSGNPLMPTAKLSQLAGVSQAENSVNSGEANPSRRQDAAVG